MLPWADVFRGAALFGVFWFGTLAIVLFYKYKAR